LIEQRELHIDWLGKDFLAANKVIKWTDGRDVKLNFALDITEQKRAAAEKARLEDQLRQAQRMEAIGTLAGGIAHDFNNLLTIIIGFAQVAQMKMSPQYLPADELKEVEAAGFRARDLVSQILTYSRQMPTEKEEIDLVPILKETLKLIRATVPANVDIHWEIPDGQAQIVGNGSQIHQVLLNLVTNAAQAMKDIGGTMKVSLSEVRLNGGEGNPVPELAPGAYYSLTVQDTGVGMEAQVLERIFNPFFTTKKPGEGTGLGLSVVHGIVKDHGGGIRVESKPGQGSSFFVYLPKHQGQEWAPAARKDEASHGTGRILFVDDQEMVLKAVGTMIKELGYEVASTTDPEDLLKIFRDDPGKFDLVIADYDMPQMTGLELSQKILSIRPSIPVILISGSASPDIMAKARDLGIREVVIKPLLVADIAEKIKKVLRAR
jgi:signal transduction histidine kinase/CheY-like chemotaxis protein